MHLFPWFIYFYFNNTICMLLITFLLCNWWIIFFFSVIFYRVWKNLWSHVVLCVLSERKGKQWRIRTFKKLESNCWWMWYELLVYLQEQMAIGRFSSRFSNNSEAFNSKLLKNLQPHNTLLSTSKVSRYNIFIQDLNCFDD